MRTTYRLVEFNFSKKNRLQDFLKKYQITYRYNENLDSIEFYLYNNMINASDIFKEIEIMSAKNDIVGIQLHNIENEFTEEELDQAEWIEVEVNSRFQYAEPSEGAKFRDIYYETIGGCEKCRYSFKQIEPISLRKSLWFTEKRNITGTLNIMGEFFISEKAKKWLEESDLKGFDIWNVYNTKRNQFIDNTYQIHVQTTLDFPMQPESYAEKKICEQCGMDYYVSNRNRSQIVYKKKHFTKKISDIVKTKEKTGVAFYESDTLISHNMYLFLKEHNMLKDLKLNVVILED